MNDVSKKYWRIKYNLAFIELVYLLLLLFISLKFNFSRSLLVNLSRLIESRSLIIAVYLMGLYTIYCLLNFPFHFYQTFILEHKFLLSHQKFIDWLKDSFKMGFIFYIVSLILVEFFYFSLNWNFKNWWIIVSLFWVFLSVILTKILPIFIIPLFFKYKKITDEEFKNSILELAKKMKLKLIDIFEIDLSKKTLKANAAFIGLGRTKRVILADTLKDNYTPDEIKVILAHEFAHYRLRHILKLLFIEALSIFGNFYFIFISAEYFFKRNGFLSLKEVAGLPIIFIYLILWSIITEPLKNFIKRKFERNADMLALKVSGLNTAFISLMEKLAKQNLADRNPHPLIKFFFFDHPPIEERIKLAINLK